MFLPCFVLHTLYTTRCAHNLAPEVELKVVHHLLCKYCHSMRNRYRKLLCPIHRSIHKRWCCTSASNYYKRQQSVKVQYLNTMTNVGERGREMLSICLLGRLRIRRNRDCGNLLKPHKCLHVWLFIHLDTFPLWCLLVGPTVMAMP